jgi:hypothetical protein
MTGDDDTRARPEPRPRRKREPATIDLTARTIGETNAGAPADHSPAEQGVEPDVVQVPPPAAGTEMPQAVDATQDHLAGISGAEATVSAATVSESAAEAVAEAPSPADTLPPEPPEPAPSSVPPFTPKPSPPPPVRTRGPGAPALIASAVGGGLLGALIVAAGLWLFGPDIGGRFAAVETQMGGLAPATSVQALDGRVAAVDQGLKALGGQVDALAKRPAVPPAEVAGLGTRLGDVERRVGEIESRPAPAPSGEASAEPAPVAPAPPPPPPAPVVGARESAVLSVAMLVRDALSSGRGYERELSALKQAGVEQDVLSALDPFARTGAPSGTAMAASFAPIKEKLSQSQPVSSGATLSERVQNGLARIFKVRRSGDVAGDDPASIAARAQHQLGLGQFAAAAQTLEGLPEPQRSEAAAFVAQIRTRLAAQQAVDVLLSQAVDRLLAVTSAPGGAAQ